MLTRSDLKILFGAKCLPVDSTRHINCSVAGFDFQVLRWGDERVGDLAVNAFVGIHSWYLNEQFDA